MASKYSIKINPSERMSTTRHYHDQLQRGQPVGSNHMQVYVDVGFIGLTLWPQGSGLVTRSAAFHRKFEFNICVMLCISYA
jgi:hypothetical protein